jgi:hypothetical protein
MWGALLWPLAIVVVWAGVFCLAVGLATAFARSHDAEADAEVGRAAHESIHTPEPAASLPAAL